MRLLTVFLISYSILATTARAQQNGNADSLIRILPAATNDTIKARVYKQIAEAYALNYPDTALRYAETGMKHVSKMQWKKGIAVFNMLIGNLESDKGNYRRAIELHRTAYEFHIANQDYFNAASSLNNWGSAYQRQSVLDKAGEKYFEALALAEKETNNYLIGICLSNIAKIYSGQNDFDKALEYDFRALEIQEKDPKNSPIGDTYSSIANTYLQKKDTSRAQRYYNDALQHHTTRDNNFGLASVYTNMSNLFRDKHVVLDYRIKAQLIWDELSPSHPLSIVNLGNLSLTWLAIARELKRKHQTHSEELSKADSAVTRAIRYSIDVRDKGNYAFLVGIRSELEAEKGNFAKAYANAILSHSLNDSIYSQESKNRIAALEGAREVAIRDKRIEMDAVVLSAQRRQNIGLILGVLMLLIIGLLLFRQNRIRKNTNSNLVQLNTQLSEANEFKAKFLAILSHDLRSPLARLISFLHLQKNAPDIMTSVQAEKHQQNIVSSAENLLENIETILLWSKGQMSEFKPVPKKVALNDLFTKLQDSFKGYEKIKWSFSDPQKIQIVTDENYLYTIMQNLTANATKALNETSEPKIHWTGLSENNEVLLSIGDNGPGINDTLIYEMFNDPEDTRNSRNGFGLFIVRDLSLAINCRIEIQSNGAGTSFSLRLPAN